jgi:hypothetical protein
MLFTDHLTLDAPRRNRETGFLAVRAKAARTGVYDYAGTEVDPTNAHGLRDQPVVKVLRDVEQVFDPKAAHSFIGKPITDNHPAAPVTSSNWKDHARGTVMGAKWEEGGYLAFDLLLTDASAIAAVDNGKRELSNGYSCDLQFGDFTAADGTKCQAKQVGIVGNHIALVDRGRAGPDCRITDAATCDRAPVSIFDSLTNQEKPVSRTLTVDGLPVNVADADAATATITRLIEQRDAATGSLSALQTTAVTDAATLVAKDAEIARLTSALADAKPTLQQLRDAGKAFAIIEGKAKAAGVTVTDAMDENAIMKAVVDKAMPGNTYAGEHIAVAFAALTKDAKIADTSTVVPIGAPVVLGDAAEREATALAEANDFNGWRTAGQAA